MLLIPYYFDAFSHSVDVSSPGTSIARCENQLSSASDTDQNLAAAEAFASSEEPWSVCETRDLTLYPREINMSRL